MGNHRGGESHRCTLSHSLTQRPLEKPLEKKLHYPLALGFENHYKRVYVLTHNELTSNCNLKLMGLLYFKHDILLHI